MFLLLANDMPTKKTKKLEEEQPVLCLKRPNDCKKCDSDVAFNLNQLIDPNRIKKGPGKKQMKEIHSRLFISRRAIFKNLHSQKYFFRTEKSILNNCRFKLLLWIFLDSFLF